MNRIILASHGGLSEGMKDTVSMVLGDVSNIYAVATQREETEGIIHVTRQLFSQFDQDDNIYILTDILGGSVNNDMMMLLKEYPKVTIIAGMNLSLVLLLAMDEESITENEVSNMIEQAKQQIVNCGELLSHATKEEEVDIL